MKNVLFGLLILGTFSSFANTVTGVAEFKKYPTLENSSLIIVTGDVAAKIWDDMTSVNVSPSNQYQPNDMKIGDGIHCEKLKSGPVSCYLRIITLNGGSHRSNSLK